MAYPYPSPYQPTLQDPIPYYRPSDPTADERCVLYGASIGVCYIGPYLNIPFFFRSGSTLLLWGLTLSPEIQNKAYLLKNLPKGLRGGRPWLVENYDVNYFIDDKIIDSSQTSSLSFRGITSELKNGEFRANLTYTSLTGYNGTPWPSQGVTVMNSFMRSYFEELAKAGATLDFLMNDTEAVRFSEINGTLLASFTGNTSYYLPFGGVSSWNDLLTELGATASNLTLGGGQYYLYRQPNWAWFKVAQKYVSENVRQAYFNSASEIYPHIITSNYDYYEGEKIRQDEAIVSNGQLWPQGGYAGNAGSPVLYGRLRHITADQSTGHCVRREDSSYLWNWNIERRGLHRLGPLLLHAPSVSFLQAMMELKTAKRNAYNVALAPWINSIYTLGYGFEGHFFNNVFTIGQNQSAAEILHDHWYGINVSSNLYTSGGITSYNGSTTANLIKVSIPLVSNAWYKQNIDSITFDGSTLAYQLKTSGTTGTTSAFAYYYSSGFTSGDTYVFSYFVDVSRGFTGFNGRFILWNTSDSIALAPSLTTTSGITFEQLLPVTGGQVYLESPIAYDPGNSGWTKVAWSFRAPSSTSRIGLHAYHAKNDTIGGNTVYIKDVYLNHQVNGTTLALNSPEVKNREYSLEYYYNGITPGSTYIFSYYVDMSRSYTGSNSIQTINHFQIPTYYLPIGITFNQILPVTVNSNFNTAGISYGSSTGWTKLAFEFNIPVGDTYDPIHRNTFAASVFRASSSVFDSNDILTGPTFYIASPSVEIQGLTVSTSIPVAPINFESITRWNFGPPIGWADAIKGPNPRYNAYLLARGGNSAYFGELIRHCCLCGSAKFGLFNPSDYVNYGLTGTLNAGGDDLAAGKIAIYKNSGLTQHITSFLHLDSVLKDVHQKIGGFTTASGEVGRVDWLAPYVVSGAPDTKGLTWWWRYTALPGYTTYVNGITLTSYGNIGTWVGTTGNTTSSVDVSYTKWTKNEVNPEPTIASPSKEINFAGMTNLSQLLLAGVSFTRGSTASYIDATGKIAFAGPNQPRFHHDKDTLEPLGLLLEVAHTNLLNWSESFASTGGSQNNWNTNKLERTVGSTAPSGLTFAIRFTATGSDATLLSSSAIGSNAFRSFSIFVRGITGNESVSYTMNNGATWTPITGTTTYVYFGDFGLTYTVKQPPTQIPTVWKRFTFTPTTDNHRVGIKLGNTGDSVELWGAQVETRTSTSYDQRELATSYIPTTSTTASTSADACSIRGTSFSSWYGQTYGSFVVEERNVMDAFPINLEKDSSNYFRLNPNNLWMYVSSRKNGVVSNPLISQKVITQEICVDVDYKFMLTYGPYGMKYGSYNVYDYQYYNIRSIPWPGNTIGAPEATFLSFNPNDTMTVKRMRYWPFVFDEETMKGMAKGNVDGSIGLFGTWEK